VIIDGGTFAGSSSLALGFGLKDRGFPRRKVIHAFDTFIIDAGSEITLDRNDPLSADIKGGDSIRPLYDRNVAEVASYIEVHHGDVLQKPWSGERIEILFCDICKMLPINDYVLEQWIARLIPGRGLLIQQDQVQEHHVWIAITMSILSDYFEIVDFVPHSTIIYRLKQKIPRKALKHALYLNVTLELMERHYLRSLEMFRALDVPHRERWHLVMVELGLPVLYGFHIGDMDKAWHALNVVKKEFSSEPDTMRRAGELEKHLAAKTPCPGSRLYWEHAR
jgi:hypothetical protein